MALAFCVLAMTLFAGLSGLLYGRLSLTLMECAQQHGRFGVIEPREGSGRGRPVRARLQAQACAA
jgi:hypothetical protein